MLPDFSAPAYQNAVLAAVAFRHGPGDRPRVLHSDLRCEAGELGGDDPLGRTEARVHFVGLLDAESGNVVPAVVAFLSPLRIAGRPVAPGMKFGLFAGSTLCAEVLVHAVVGVAR
jgi:hypothetical protein